MGFHSRVAMDVSFENFYVVRYRSLRQNFLPSKVVLPSVVCVSLSVIRCNSILLHLQCVGRSRQNKKERKKDSYYFLAETRSFILHIYNVLNDYNHI